MLATLAQFQQVAQQTPNQIAVIEGERQTSYQALLQRVVQLRARIAQRFSVITQRAVMIALPRSADAYAAMFAARAAGGFYVPLNLDSPASKLLSIIRQISPAVILVNQQTYALLSGHIEASLLLQVDQLTAEANDDTAVNGTGLQPREPHPLAYVLFTSGTTGTPKGVCIGQAALEHYVAWVLDCFKPTLEDRWSQHASLAFDICMTDIYGALCSGATLCVPMSEMDRLLPSRWIQEQGITLWNSVPSIIDQMKRANQLSSDYLSSVRLFNFIGEPLYRDQVAALFEACPETYIQNSYGPTEVTIACLALQVSAIDWQRYADSTYLSIGQPIPGLEVALLNEELVVRGVQVAEGYWQNPEATQARFIKPPESEAELPGFKTGDAVYQDERGALYFSHRIDQQCKVNGVRVELGEIRTALAHCLTEGFEVLVHQGEIVVVVEGHPLDLIELQQQLSHYLEKNLLPKRVISVEQLPRNANDKIDCRSLLEAS